jgi:hypothetical protein
MVIPWPLVNIAWTPICIFDKVMSMVAQVTNRAFVGLPVCMTLEVKLIQVAMKIILNMLSSMSAPLQSLLLHFMCFRNFSNRSSCGI